jgi:general secretion pathway protein D
MTNKTLFSPKPLHAAMAGLFTVVLAGCATPVKEQGAEDDARTAALGHRYETSAFGKAEKPAAAEERIKLYPGTGELVKAPTIPTYQQKAGELTLSFEGADLREVVKTVLSDILKESYIMDPRVAGSITLHTKRPIPKSAVLPTLETVLRMSGAVLLRQDDGVYQVLPANMAGKGNLTPRLGEIGKPLPNGYSIQVVPLKFIGAADMAKLLEPVLPDPSAVRLDLMRNLLILSGSEPELRHMFETIEMFDVDWLAGMSVGLFTLQNVDAKTIAADLEKLFGDKNMGPLAGALRLMPIERLNALLVVTPQQKYLEQARTWIERLDRTGTGDGGQSLFVYQVQNGKAEALATLLNDAFGKKGSAKAAPAPTVAPGVKATEVATAAAKAPAPAAAPVPAPAKPAAAAGGDTLTVPGDVRIIPDKDNNALLILATAGDYEKIELALKKLDVVPRQVLIEVTIAEVTLTDELSYGLEWFMNKGRISSQLDTGDGGFAKRTPGLAYSWTSLSGDIGAVINMLATDSKIKIISSPHITVADNQQASIQVGDQVPTITQTQTTNTTTGVISSVQYLNTGVLLDVTPRVNAGGLVTLEINQEVSNAAATDTSGIDSPTISKRTAKSTVTVQSNETLVMAGLIREQNDRGSAGLPLLSEIPFLGGLFGAQTRKDDRTELIILITPRVLHTIAQAADVTAEYRKRVTGLGQMIRTLDSSLGWGDDDSEVKTGPMPPKPDSGKSKR